MPRTKILPSTRKDKKWMVKVTNPKTGKPNIIHGGDPKATIDKKRANAFKARHGNKTAKQYVNDKIWEGKRIGDTVNIPKDRF